MRVLRRLRKNFWPVHLLTLLLCGFFAARAAGQYLAARPALAPAPAPHGQSVTALAGTVPAERNIKAIVTRNIFCSDCAPAAPAETDAVANAQPSRTALPLRLLATLIDADDDGEGFATLLDTTSGHTRVAGVGEKLALEARLIAVEQRRILLENSGRKEFLPLEEEQQAGTTSIAARPESAIRTAPLAQAAALAVRSVGPGKYEIPRATLDQTLSNTAQLASWARIVPAQLKGQPAGFMVTAIRPGSLYTQLGLQDGDIVQAINGRAIRTPEDALQIYSAMRRAQHVTVSFLRQARPITHDYTVTLR